MNQPTLQEEKKEFLLGMFGSDEPHPHEYEEADNRLTALIEQAVKSREDEIIIELNEAFADGLPSEMAGSNQKKQQGNSNPSR